MVLRVHLLYTDLYTSARGRAEAESRKLYNRLCTLYFSSSTVCITSVVAGISVTCMSESCDEFAQLRQSGVTRPAVL